MSSPSPDPQKGVDHTYQSSETSDHGLLTHGHACPCNEKANIDSSKTDLHAHCLSKSSHHHNIISLSHVPANTNHIHPINQSVHVHVHASPKTAHTPKIPSTCTCHLQEDADAIAEADGSLGQSARKLEADDRIEVSNLPPALPPRPPPRPRLDGTLNSRHRPRNRKYTADRGGEILTIRVKRRRDVAMTTSGRQRRSRAIVIRRRLFLLTLFQSNCGLKGGGGL
ncbi:hypothetical protein BDFB_007382 [Asbolus verrucosus]|uniref:Uncharacterized protein n=1 Tax=Asbolus verrucosus TaxID=1661398 RepID=A0A482VVI7_ASBVE|nr:hypothetical protein BDFB_007382 [Asbolus verrucosus]